MIPCTQSRLSSLVVFAGISLFVGTARSGYSSMRCGTRLVSAGDSTYTVRSVCGPADAESRRVEQRTVRRVVHVPCREQANAEESPEPLAGRCRVVEEHTIEIVIDEWTYDFGRNRFVQYVLFEDGRLATVEVGGYGTK